jgi:putative peptidoglycan lipid II flippase
MSNEAVASTKTLARATLIMMVAFAVARVISIAQTVVLTSTFGVSAAWDRYISASQIPEQLFMLFAGGALANALIPLFSSFLARDARADAWRLASHVVNTIFIVVCLASLLAFFAAPWLLRTFVASGFDDAAIIEAAGLMRVLLLTTIIFSISGIMMGVLQSHNRFLAPALAPILFDVGILFGVLFLVERFGIYGVAYGTVLGALLHLGIQIPALLRVGARWTFELGWNDPNARRVYRLMAPRIIDVAAFNIGMSTANNFASQLGDGAVSAWSWGWRLMQIPQTLIGTAMGMVIFPTLAALSELNDVDGKRNAMAGALKFILIGTIPAAIGLILVGRPALALLEGGAFDSAGADLIMIALRGFALGIVVHSILEVATRSFFADKDTFTPMLVAIGGVVVNIGTSALLSGVLSANPSLAGVGGIAWGNTLGVTFEVTLLLFLLHRRWQGIQHSELARITIKTLAASLIMGIAIIAFEALWRTLGLAESGRVLTIAQVALQVLVGAAVFIGAAYLLKLEEINTLLRQIFRRKSIAEAVA